MIGIVVAGTAAFLGAAWGVGALRERRETRRVHEELLAGVDRGSPQCFDPKALEALPEPARRWLGRALEPGAPLLPEVRLRHAGRFLLDERRGRWVPFRSDQLVVAAPPGFDWNARLRIAPGLAVRVRDAYVRGEGRLRARFAGWIPLAAEGGRGELARAELLRWLAETAWYPELLLVAGDVAWEAAGPDTVRVTVQDGGVRAIVTLDVDTDGLVRVVRCEDRPRLVDGALVPTPWEGRWTDWERVGGALVPREGEVAWIVEGERRPYWRGRLVERRVARGVGDRAA